MGLFKTLFRQAPQAYSEGRAKYYDNDEDRQKRLERYKKAWDAYLAELPDPIIQDSPSNDNVKVNPTRAIINTGVYFLFGHELKFQVSPDANERMGGKKQSSYKPLTDNFKDDADGEEDRPKPSQEKGDGESASVGGNNHSSNILMQGPVIPPYLTKLNQCWKANRKKSFFFNLGLSGALHGDVFVKIIPDAAGTKNEFPRVVMLDPANVDVETDPNDVEKVIKWCIEYVTEVVNEVTGEKEPTLRIQEITAVQDAFGTIQSWEMQDYEQPMGYIPGTGYVPYEGERQEVGPMVPWPYPWAPIEHCQNIELPHMFWGLPDLDESSVDVIESIQRSMSSLNKIVRIHASPRMFAKNVMPDQIEEIDISADNIITLPNMESELSVLQTMNNLAPSIEYAREQRKMMLEMLQTPAIALGEFETASTAISGVTLSILYAPILQKTDLKRVSYGDMIERLNTKLLILMGFEPEEFEDLTLVWPEAMPGSAYLERQTLEQDQMMGVSEYTLHSKLGYDPVEERKRKMEEQEELMALQKKYAPEPAFGEGGFGNNKPGGGETRGGNNNPQGKGNKSGSMGGTKAAGTPKSSPGQNK